MSISRKNLYMVKDYAIDLLTLDANTFSVQIVDTKDQTLIADLPLDPMDNTVAAVLDKKELSKLGADAELLLEKLSNVLQEQIGAKEFIVLPSGFTLPDYVRVEQQTKLTRLRQANRLDLENKAAAVLAQYSDLTDELDKHYESVVGIDAITQKLQSKMPYEKILALLLGHANFTEEKTNEYKIEDVLGAKARFNNSKVTSLAILNSSNDLRGVIRVLSMGNKFAYLSDETMDQEIIAAEKFPGNKIEDKQKNRGIFLLAYLINKAGAIVKDQEHLFIIAAKDREDIYDAMGWQRFPIQSADYVATMKLSAPAPLLTSIKDRLINPISNVEAIARLGIRAVPVASEEKATVDQVPVSQKKY